MLRVSTGEEDNARRRSLLEANDCFREAGQTNVECATGEVSSLHGKGSLFTEAARLERHNFDYFLERLLAHCSRVFHPGTETMEHTGEKSR